MGLPHSPWQALSSAIKMPILFIGAGLFCLPALHLACLTLGTSLRMAQVATVVLAGISVTAFFLLGLSPVMLIFALTSNNYPFFQLLIVASMTVSGCIGLYYLWRGIIWVNLFERASANVRRVLMSAWFVMYAFVGSQMAWRLSPFVGDPALPFTILQPSHDNLYVETVRALDHALGSPSLTGAAQPMWIGGLLLLLVMVIVGIGLATGTEEA
jgi:hypothetical protein